jgi:hypothetical protein
MHHSVGRCDQIQILPGRSAQHVDLIGKESESDQGGRIVLLIGIYRRDQSGEMIGDACKEKASEHFFVEKKISTMEAIAKGRKTVDVGLHGSAAGGFVGGTNEVAEVCDLLGKSTSFINFLQSLPSFPRIFGGIDIHKLITINQQGNLGIGLRSNCGVRVTGGGVGNLPEIVINKDGLGFELPRMPIVVVELLN